jgi:hypothetical protein
VVLFAAGSTCFLVAPMPWFLQPVGPQTDGAVFFAGSVLFTAAASVQWLTTVDAGHLGIANAATSLGALGFLAGALLL